MGWTLQLTVNVPTISSPPASPVGAKKRPALASKMPGPSH